MRLLLVDDDAGFRELLRTTFEAVEVEVDEAGGAAEAEARIGAMRPDVIVLDVGMPGMDHSSSGNGGHATMTVRSMTPARFAAASTRRDATVINVHTPYEGELPGTDASIPYDRIADGASLPRNKQALVLLYCRSGRMSDIAARTLMDAGYTNVTQLRGGMNAWEAAGYELLGQGS